MKKILAIACAIFAASQFATAAAKQPAPAETAAYCAPTKKVTLEAGTLVILESNESLFSGKLTPGKMVQMRVRTNVYAEGEVVIRTGAQAIGRVKSIEETNYNAPGSVTIELFYVQTVDGQQAALNGNEQTFNAPDPNDDETNVPVNSMITSQIMNDMDIKVK